MVARLSEMPLQTLKNHLSGRTRRVPLEDLRRIAETCGLPPGWIAGVDERAEPSTGFGEDLVPFEPSLPRLPERPPLGTGRWTVASRALDLAGFLPGDVVEFDLSDDRPRAGEVVVAQLYDVDGSGRTVLRLCEPPYLVVQTGDPSIPRRPVEIGPQAVVMGRFLRMTRERR